MFIDGGSIAKAVKDAYPGGVDKVLPAHGHVSQAEDIPLSVMSGITYA